MTHRDLSWDALVTALYEQNQFAIKYDLDAMRAALDLENLGEPAPIRVLVGGTNGKGTTSCLLHSTLAEAGLRTGLYTSPHLVDFRERIRVDGRCIPPAHAARIGWALFDRYAGRNAPSAAGRALSYFELATLLAFSWFREQSLDAVVLEVGLGGRLDATNACDPTHAVLTSVGLDHEAYLGPTVERIAAEKAHIARPGRPLYVCPQSRGAAAILCTEPAQHARTQLIEVEALETPAPPSQTNAALAAAVARDILVERGLSPVQIENAILEGHARARWPGRQESRVLRGVPFWIDGAHNADSVAACVPWVDALLASHGRSDVDAIVAVSPGRDAASLFLPLRDRMRRVRVVPADAQRTQDPVAVAAALRVAGFDAMASTTIDEAVTALHNGTAPILVVGSLYLVGGVYRWANISAEQLVVRT
jgi:dihydrofolate synthase/folylpolyglutamate synthase